MEELLRKLGDVRYHERLHKLVTFFGNLGPEYNPDKKQGGFFFIHGSLSSLPILATPCGVMPHNKWTKYRLLAGDTKPHQLIRNPSHDLSWQSRDKARDFWGGAVRCTIPNTNEEVILSFSGLTEAGDEVVCLCMAIIYGLMTINRARELADISGSRALLELFLTDV